MSPAELSSPPMEFRFCGVRPARPVVGGIAGRPLPYSHPAETAYSIRSISVRRIDPIVSYPAPPAAPTVVRASPVPEYPRHQGGSFVPPWKGGIWWHTPAAGGACGGVAIAARETRTPQCESLLRSVSLRLALVDR